MEEEGVAGGVRQLSDLVRVNVERVGVFQELAVEPPKDQEIFLVFLEGSAPLAFGKELGVDLNDFPCRLFGVVVHFDGVDILAGFVFDSAHHVDVSVVEGARRMIVTTNVQVGHLEPKVNVRVVHLAT